MRTNLIPQSKHHGCDHTVALSPETPSLLSSNSELALPIRRLRRMRRTESLRALVRETVLSPADLILPIFVEENTTERTPIPAMPDVFRETEHSLEKIVQEAYRAGIQAVILFGISHHKDSEGTQTFVKGGLLDRMTRRAKQACPEISVIVDVCFCEYTDHGHCGVWDPHAHTVDNDRTLANLQKQAIMVCEAGADIIAPSGMMDGMVYAIRSALDSTGFSHIPILSYAAKFASVYYGPFREAAGCSLGKGGHRKTYQMDPANGREALREAFNDIEEGADMLMVKPGMPYLDILAHLRTQTLLPLAAYQVSGEYTMIQFAAQAGAINAQETLMESLLCFKRAGADFILTYGALSAARVLGA